jgi:hypothetical protein
LIGAIRVSTYQYIANGLGISRDKKSPVGLGDKQFGNPDVLISRSVSPDNVL